MKKRIIVITLAVAAVFAAALLINTKLTHDPNYMIKHSAVRLTEGKGQNVTYDCGHFIFLAPKIPIWTSLQYSWFTFIYFLEADVENKPRKM